MLHLDVWLWLDEPGGAAGEKKYGELTVRQQKACQ
jgi:hypothetical protein